jgi:hypothetical protein
VRAGRHTVAVNSEVVGPASNAVLVPPQAERFASVAGALVGTIEEHLAAV